MEIYCALVSQYKSLYSGILLDMDINIMVPANRTPQVLSNKYIENNTVYKHKYVPPLKKICGFLCPLLYVIMYVLGAQIPTREKANEWSKLHWDSQLL